MEREVVKVQREMKKGRKQRERLGMGLWESMPAWKESMWSEWRAQVKHLPGIYIIVDMTMKIMVAGEAVDLWKRMYSWERLLDKDDPVPRDAVRVFYLETILTKELLKPLRELLRWEPEQLRDVMRLQVWDVKKAEAVLKTHPMWALQPENILKENLEALEGSF